MRIRDLSRRIKTLNDKTSIQRGLSFYVVSNEKDACDMREKMSDNITTVVFDCSVTHDKYGRIHSRFFKEKEKPKS